MNETMKALSIKQPWAWLIVNGYKDVENRSFPINLRGKIYVHAGKKVDNDGAIWLWENRERLGIQACMPEWVEICNSWEQGAIIGEAEIIDCRCDYEPKSLWAESGMWQWHLANPIAYKEPIPCKGKLGFFVPEFRRTE